MSFTWSMAGLAASDFSFPAGEFSEVEMRSLGKCFELLFVAVFARIATDIIRILLAFRNGAGISATGFGLSCRGKPQKCAKNGSKDNYRLDRFCPPHFCASLLGPKEFACSRVLKISP